MIGPEAQYVPPPDDPLRHASPVLDDVEARRARAVVESRLFSGPPSRVEVGRYRVLGRIGAGGMGVVYRAHDPELDRDVAVKLMNPDAVGDTGADIARARLIREARAMARLAHPNVLHVYDVGTVDDSVFIAMELVDGESLATTLGRMAHSDATAVLRLFIDAGRGLAAAHAANIVHRDFKPENVLVGSDGRVRVGDFGLAGASVGDTDRHPSVGSVAEHDSVHQTLTRTGALLGTPKYMAPEQEAGLGPGAQSDQFSFCVALYEALYGVPPFEGESVTAYRLNVREGKIRPLAARNGVSPAIHDVIVRGLAVEPTARHAGMDALLARLKAAMRGRNNRAQHRRRASIALGALTTVGVAAVAGWLLGQQPAPPRLARGQNFTAAIERGAAESSGSGPEAEPAKTPNPPLSPVEPAAAPEQRDSTAPTPTSDPPARASPRTARKRTSPAANRGPACYFQSDLKTHFRTLARGQSSVRVGTTCYACDLADPAVFGLVPAEGKRCGRYYMCTATTESGKCPA